MKAQTGVMAAITAAVLSTVGLAQQAMFRAGVDVVVIDVAVLDQNRPVADLAAKDFVVLDNGVKQAIEVLPSASLPVDLTLLLDTSGSMTGSMESVRKEVEAIAPSLGADDQLRLLTFAWGAAEVFPMQSARGPLPFDRFAAGGATALYDALGAAMMRQRRPGRGDLAVVLTDAVDTSSVMTLSTVQEIARRSDVLLYVYVVRSGMDVQVDAKTGRADYQPLNGLAAATGGQLDVVLADKQVSRALTRTLAEFRTRYTLRYTVTGVRPAGWHDLSVALTRPGKFTIRARKGYFGG